MDFILDNDDEAVISAEQMNNALEITEYFRGTALRVYEKMSQQSGVDKKTIIKYCSELGASQNAIAAFLKVSQPYVAKILKK